MAPEMRVGRTANVVISLGILYTLTSVVAVFGEAIPAQRWYDVVTLMVAMGVIGLGYGIRYGRVGCLYTATGLFAGLTGYFLYVGVVDATWRPVMRFLLSGWAVFLLCRTIPAMSVLQQTHAKPLRTSRFGDFFLRRRAR
jgi:ABC-type branched-subunit amino acid transport system permease subunit